MSCDGKECNGGIDCRSGCAIEQLDEVEQPDCGQCYACLNDAGACVGRPVGPQAVPTLVTPPKYGPPPGFPAAKWRGMNRAERREQLKSVARAVNQVVK